MNCEPSLKMRELELESEEDPKYEPDSDEDCDACDESEIEKLFTPCRLITEEQVARNKAFVLNIAGTLDSNPNVAVGLSDNTFKVYNFGDNQLAQIATFGQHKDAITEIKFCSKNNNLFYTSSHDGTVRLWDLRTPDKNALQFRDTTLKDNQIKKINSFDVSPNNLLLAAGTDLFYDDSFILFWDVRKSSLLGGYWDSHRDDITQIRFHPLDSNSMISGSVDGLINLFDLSQSKEDNALIDSFNTVSSVEKLQWLERSGQHVISCVTHTADVQFWKLEDAQPSFHLRRSAVAEGIKRKSEEFVYVVDVHGGVNNTIILAGSNYHDGECFRGLTVVGNTVTPALGFPGNKQIIRTSWFNPHVGLLLTGGEKGILSVWDTKQTNLVAVKKEPVRVKKEMCTDR